MRIHHTKNKGDLGVILADADLVRRGYIVLYPRTEHAAFDLVAYDTTIRRFYRVQVKYRAAKNGALLVPFRTSWADRNGTHLADIDRDGIDVMCIYCPETDRCYYVDAKCEVRSIATLRLTPPRNHVRKGIRFADDFLVFPPEGTRGVGCGTDDDD